MLFLLLSAALADPAPGALDGRVYTVTVQDPDQGEKPETFVFDAGTFDARESHQYGFVKGPYTATSDGGTLSFTATLKSPTAGAITWTGRITGDVLTGSAEWARKGRPVEHFGFDGKVRH